MNVSGSNRSSRLLASTLLPFLLPLTVFAGGRPVDDRDTVVLRGNVHPLAKPQNEIGRAALDTGVPLKEIIAEANFEFLKKSR